MQRTTDEKSYQRWLESLQGSIVLRRQGSTLKRKSRTTSAVITSENISSPILNRQQKSKSTVHVLRPIMTDESEMADKKSKLSRISLNFIPGHGKKYSTYDSSHSYFRVDPITTEGVAEWDDSAAEKIVDQTHTSDVRSRIKRESKKPRPTSGSVSNFMLMNGPDCDKSKSEVKIKMETAETKEEPTSSSTGSITKKKNHLPKLPTSFGVGKLLAHLESSSRLSMRRASKSMNSLLEVPNILNFKRKSGSEEINPKEKPIPVASKSDDILIKHDVDLRKSPLPTLEIIEVTPDHPSCLPESKQEEARAKTPDPPQPIQQQSPKQQTLEKSPQQQPIQEVGASANVEEDLEEAGDKKKDKKKKGKDPTRRKSGLAMLRNFFYATKIGMRRKGDSTDKDKLSVSDSRSRKTSKESTTPDKTSARTSLTNEFDIKTSQQSEPVIQHKEKPIIAPVQAAVAIPAIPLIQRKDSIISEGAVSVREEAFVATTAYHLEARVIEVIEPEPTIPTIKQESIPPVTVMPDHCSAITDVNKLTGHYDELTVEKQSPQRKSVTFADVSPEDTEVAELRPSLPIKTKVKSPSPCYDIPRTTPIPIPGAEKYGEILTDYATISSTTPVVNQMEATQSSISGNEISGTKLQSDIIPVDCLPPQDNPPKEENVVRKLSQQYIQLTFDSGQTKKETVADETFTVRESSAKSADTNRFSFARSETELVKEERVKSLQTE